MQGMRCTCTARAAAASWQERASSSGIESPRSGHWKANMRASEGVRGATCLREDGEQLRLADLAVEVADIQGRVVDDVAGVGAPAHALAAVYRRRRRRGRLSLRSGSHRASRRACLTGGRPELLFLSLRLLAFFSSVYGRRERLLGSLSQQNFSERRRGALLKFLVAK